MTQRELPILFTAPMVRATIEGRKTQTRRVVKLPDNAIDVFYYAPPSGRSQPGWADPGVRYLVPDPEDSLPPGFPDEVEPWPHSLHIDPCPYGQPGDRLYVRETFAGRKGVPLGQGKLFYRADGEVSGRQEPLSYYEREDRWRPSIHMPKWAARIWLDVTGVRVERVQDISEADAAAEGAEPEPVPEHHPQCQGDCRHCPVAEPSYAEGFRLLWDSLNPKPGHGWDANPWVWVIEFRRSQ